MKTKAEKQPPKPVHGAATYEAIGKDIFMTDSDGYVSCIDYASTHDIAKRKAENWQRRENRVVLKNQGMI